MVHAPFLSAAFSSAPPFQGWPINVKNTFINFDVPPRLQGCNGGGPGTRRSRRAASCPRSFCSNLTDDNMATQELCHAMTPKQPSASKGKCFPATQPASRVPDARIVEECYEYPLCAEPSQISRPPKKLRNNKTKKPPAALAASPTGQREASEQEPPLDLLASKAATPVNSPGKQDSPYVPGVPRKLLAPAEGVVVDDISELSTASSATPETVAQEESTKWTSITAKKKSKPRIDTTCPAEGKFQAVENSQSQSHSSQDKRDRPAPRPGYPGSPKGLPFFRKIEVGIEDDMEFRVVQRLIGPRGKYMQDITERCRGAKVWIIGKGSRSREDSVGPLMICVGATSQVEFETAVGHINDLLSWVHKEHRRFHRM